MHRTIRPGRWFFRRPQDIILQHPRLRSQHFRTRRTEKDVPGDAVRRSGVPKTLIFGLLAISTGNLIYLYLNLPDSQHKVLNTSTFTPFTLLSRSAMSSTSSIFTLQQVNLPKHAFEAYKKNIWSIEIKQPQLQIARAYTPLPTSATDLNLLIRKEKNGEVSSFLHALPLAADIQVRGPRTEYTIPDHVTNVVFLAGGTGIAPALQVADAVGHKAKVDILWANRKREECLGGTSDTPVPQGWTQSLLATFFGNHQAHTPEGQKNDVVALLDTLRETKNVKVDYFVDEEYTFISPTSVTKALTQKADDIEYREGKKLLFVSGPEGFINHWAGPKLWTEGKEIQGPLGGVLGHLDLNGWEVVKL